MMRTEGDIERSRTARNARARKFEFCFWMAVQVLCVDYDDDTLEET